MSYTEAIFTRTFACSFGATTQLACADAPLCRVRPRPRMACSSPGRTQGKGCGLGRRDIGSWLLLAPHLCRGKSHLGRRPGRLLPPSSRMAGQMVCRLGADKTCCARQTACGPGASPAARSALEFVLLLSCVAPPLVELPVCW